jgi:MFS superfamily sulfate permease-like transporter
MATSVPASPDSPSRLLSRISNFVPAVGWIRSYQPAWLRGDVIAGLTLAAYLLPAGIGDASLAGLPPQAGIYACLFSGLVFWLFCSSRHSLLYFNVEYVRETILARVRGEAVLPKLVILDLSASPHVDLQSGATLLTLADELAGSGIGLQVVEARSSVRDRLRVAGLDEKVGGIDRLRTVAQAVEEFERREAA